MIIEVPDDTPIIEIARFGIRIGCETKFEKAGNLKMQPNAELTAERERIRAERQRRHLDLVGKPQVSA